MIRVGSLHDLETLGSSSVDKKSGMTATEQLRAIYEAVGPLYEKRERVFRDVEQQLRLHGVYQLSAGELGTAEQKYLRHYFDENPAPILPPRSSIPITLPPSAKQGHPRGARLRRKGKEVPALIPVPAAAPDVVFLPGSDVRCIPTEQILLSRLSTVFSTYTVEEATAFCVTRNADINPEDEAFDFDDDFRGKMRKVLGKRRRLDPVRLEYSGAVSEPFLTALLRAAVPAQRSDLPHRHAHEAGVCLFPGGPAGGKQAADAVLSPLPSPDAVLRTERGDHDPSDPPARPAALLPL